MHNHEKQFDPHRQQVLINDERKARWDPPQFLSQFALQVGQTVLDVGSGPGFWTLTFAEMVGSTGEVWALDVSQELLDALKAHNPPSQVHLSRTELPKIDLPAATADFAWLAFVFHEVEPPEELANELRRVLKPNGRVAVLDWRPDGVSDQNPPRHHRVSPEQVIAWLRAAGFTRVEQTWQDADNYLVEASGQ